MVDGDDERKFGLGMISKDRLGLVVLGFLVAVVAHWGLKTSGPAVFVGVFTVGQALIDIYLRLKIKGSQRPVRGWKQTKQTPSDVWRVALAGVVCVGAYLLPIETAEQAGVMRWIQFASVGWFVSQLTQLLIPIKRV